MLLEVHVLDFAGDLYGRHARVRFLDFIRPEQKFDGLDALKAQIGADCETAKSALADVDLNYIQEGFLKAVGRPTPPSATQWFLSREDSGVVDQSPYV